MGRWLRQARGCKADGSLGCKSNLILIRGDCGGARGS